MKPGGGDLLSPGFLIKTEAYRTLITATMQRIRNLKLGILIALSTLGVTLGSCDSLLYDNLENCPQGVYVKFYSKTPCDTDSSFIGNVPSLSVFAFDENDRLVAVKHEENLSLTKDFELLMPVSNGNFTFLAWAGISDSYSVREFQIGDSKSDLLLTLKSTSGVATQLKGQQLWQGESPAIYLPDPATVGRLYKHTAINLREITNRITINVTIDRNDEMGKGVDEKAKDLTAELTSANGLLAIDGSSKRNGEILSYQDWDKELSADQVVFHYTTLDLITGLNNNLKLSFGKDSEGNDKTVIDNDLIAFILLRAQDAGAVSLECDNDFEINFRVINRCEDCPSYFSCYISINNWGVHSYEIEL